MQPKQSETKLMCIIIYVRFEYVLHILNLFFSHKIMLRIQRSSIGDSTQKRMTAMSPVLVSSSQQTELVEAAMQAF